VLSVILQSKSQKRRVQQSSTVSSDEKAAHAHQAGADYILNHRTESVVERVKEITNGKGVDLSIDVDAANASILPDIIAHRMERLRFAEQAHQT